MTKGELIKRLIDESFDDNTPVTTWVRSIAGYRDIEVVMLVDDERAETGHTIVLELSSRRI